MLPAMIAKGIPLRLAPGALHARAVARLARFAVAIGAGAFTPDAGSPAEIAKRAWGANAARDVQTITRAPSSPASTTTSGWAAELAPVVLQFISSLSPQSAGADLLQRGLQLRFDGAASISLPTISTT